MKSLFANRAFQWVFVLLVCVGLAVFARLYLPTEPLTPSMAGSTEPVPETMPTDTVTPPVPTAPAPLSQRVVEYHMSVTLDAERKSLAGAEMVSWTNPGKKPVDTLYFHLYANAFESKKTTFNRESGGKLREDAMSADSFGGITIDTVRTEEGDELVDRLVSVRPDDGNPNDNTLVKLPLPKPVGPGEKVTLKLQYTVRLPKVFARMGYAGDFTMAGQWFPKVAVYEPAGMRGRTEEGWNLHQYHGNSEFYGDFGIYNVRINVPAAYTVAATGFPTKPPVTEGDRKTYRFYADDVHDFAWAASPDFVYVEDSFSAENVPGVRIKLYLDPKHKDLKTRYLLAAKRALSRYSDWYGPYPYNTLSIVVPPADANGAGGMEYPTLVTAWGAANAKPSLELERVVVHEIGHQYWYGMVASNEYEEAWLDEGFTSYAEDKVMESEYGVHGNWPLEGSYITSPAPLKQNAWAYDHRDQYADNVYTRAKLVLLAIEQEIGPKTMSRVLKSYFSKWKFRHPSTEDFQAVLEKTTDRSWSGFFNQYVYGGLMVDYSVDRIEARATGKGGEEAYDNEVLIRKKGAEHSPVPVRFHFTDGHTVDKTWDGEAREVKFTLAHGTPVDWVMVDPDRTLLLENKHMNNFMLREIDMKWKVRWNLGAVKLIETLFSWVAW